MGSAWDRLDEMDERPDRHRKRAFDRRETARIPRHRSVRTVLAAAFVVVGGAVAVWAFRENLGLVKGAGPIAAGTRAEAVNMTPAPVTVTSIALAEGTGSAPTRGAAAGAAKAVAGTTQPAAEPAPGYLAEVERGVAARPRASPSGGRRTPVALPPSIPSPPPAPPEPVAAAPIPTPPPPLPAAPAVDVDGLLKEAQQAWSRRYYGVAIDKAREVLKASPGRHDAYQIIAVCSCAVGAAEDAREAASHLDSYKQRLVRSLCKNHGVTLE